MLGVLSLHKVFFIDFCLLNQKLHIYSWQQLKTHFSACTCFFSFFVLKDGKVRDTCCMGAKEESLEAKAVTVVTGPDMVNISFVTFFSHTSQLAEVRLAVPFSASTRDLKIMEASISSLSNHTD